MDRYAIVKQTWFSGLKHRIGQRGKIVETVKSSLDYDHDSFKLEFDDGEQSLFARHELDLQSQAAV